MGLAAGLLLYELSAQSARKGLNLVNLFEVKSTLLQKFDLIF